SSLTFFSQAEDGIRDFHVTGVQTCALPISNTAANYNVDIFIENRAIAGAAVPSENSEYSIALRGQAPIVMVDGIQRDIFSIDPEDRKSVVEGKSVDRQWQRAIIDQGHGGQP